MKSNIKKLRGRSIITADGTDGGIKDFLFDEEKWVIRYLEVDFGNLFTSNRILIPRALLKGSVFGKDDLIIQLTRDDLERCPKPEDDLTVSRKYEEELNKYYRLENYWAYSYPYPSAVTGMFSPPRRTGDEVVDLKENNLNTSLHSFNEVSGYKISAVDGDLGHLEDMIIDEADWQINYVVVDTSNWLPWSKKVVLAIGHIEDISFAKREAKVSLHTETIKNAPEFDPSKQIDAIYEKSLHDFYEKSLIHH